MPDTPNAPDMRETITKALEFAEKWFGAAQEGEPISDDEIDLVKDLVSHIRSLLDQLEVLQEACDGNEMSAKDAMAERDDLQAQLEAKDAEIARIRGLYERERDIAEQAQGQIAERDATIAKMARCLAWYENDAAEEARRFHFGTVPSDIGQRASACLAALKETSHE